MQENTPLISVIVPVYNTGKYLTPCLESIKGQTYSNLEILLVDDGSTDNSGVICDSYALNDNRIKVIHKENGGVSSARNLGITTASGKYLSFLDSDDRIEPDYLERLYSDIIEYGADIACCNCIEVAPDNTPLKSNIIRVKNNRLITDKEDILWDNINKKEQYFSSAWASLIKAELAKKFRFRSYRFAEDYMYMFELFLASPKVYLDKYVGYRYVRWDGSVSAESFSFSRAFDHLQIDTYCYSLLNDVSDRLKDEFYLRYALQLHQTAYSTSYDSAKENRKQYRNMLKEYISSITPVRKCLPRNIYYYLELLSKAPRLYYLLSGINEGLHKICGIK